MLLLLSLLLAACASVLGIEERTLDTAASYPSEGYAGCRPDAGCEACLEVHRSECRARAVCASGDVLESCASCVCEQCLVPVVDCHEDASCAAIWQCLRETRCDLSVDAAGSCQEACSSAIEQNGGVTGDAFRAAVAIRSCAVAETCLSCLPVRDEPPLGCRPQNGCMECADCFQQCLCSGDTFSTCSDLCGEDAPPEACSEADACLSCADCFDLCACQGRPFEECTDACRLETSTCTVDDGCAECADCTSQCVCNGASETDCQSACQPLPSDDLCREKARGQNETCGGCSTCLGSCSCDGTDLDDCMEDCGLLSCCGDSTCSSDLTRCICDGESSKRCLDSSLCDSVAGSCDSCSCGRCPDKFELCQDTPGCPAIFECMRSTSCQGSVCVERCSAASSPSQTSEAAEAFGVAEALWACNQAAACTCSAADTKEISCGASACLGHVGANATLDACCPDVAAAEVTGAPTEACGLLLEPYFASAPGCTPRNQPSAPRELLESCPALVVGGPPYNGAKLLGCCRQADNLCGNWDDITGLGCLGSDIFGQTSRPCL